MIKIGVIIPTYERKELLLRALVSLQKQTYENWEAYVVDDCSSEDVKSYLDGKGMFEDKRIHYTRLEKNSGVNIARNFALEQILQNETISYVTLLDDDDYFLVDYFEKATAVIKKEFCPWLVTKCVDENRDNITQIKLEGDIHYLDYLSADKLQNDATMMIKKELLHDIHFTTALRNGY